MENGTSILFKTQRRPPYQKKKRKRRPSTRGRRSGGGIQATQENPDLTAPEGLPRQHKKRLGAQSLELRPQKIRKAHDWTKKKFCNQEGGKNRNKRKKKRKGSSSKLLREATIPLYREEIPLFSNSSKRHGGARVPQHLQNQDTNDEIQKENSPSKAGAAQGLPHAGTSPRPGKNTPARNSPARFLTPIWGKKGKKKTPGNGSRRSPRHRVNMKI